MPRKILRLSDLELVRWQRAADMTGVSLSELITTATADRVAAIERDHAEDLELDDRVRRAIEAAGVTCGCERCAKPN
jgi:ABC-type branched-subunit amino acid transport system substrate-binding protein